MSGHTCSGMGGDSRQNLQNMYTLLLLFLGGGGGGGRGDGWGAFTFLGGGGAEIEALSFEQKSNWLRTNPATAARHFHYRLNVFFQDFLKSTANPLGEIVDYGIRIEFQAQGSLHAHCVI